MNLMDMKIFLDNLVDSFSIVLDLECTIINANPIKRVSGTGIYKEHPNERNWRNSYAIKVIEEKKPFVIIDTTDRTWQNVGESFKYYSVVLHPITVENMVKGVIVLASLNKKQQDMIKEKSKELLGFLEKISLLISAKFEQEILLNKYGMVNSQLSTIFSAVTDGLVLYSKEKKVMQMNERAKSILQYDNTIVHEKLIKKIYEIGNHVINTENDLEEQIYLNAQGKNYSIMVKATLSYNNDIPNSIIVLHNFKEIQNMIVQNDSKVNDCALNNIIGENSEIKKIIEKIGIIANNDSNILLLGESGTGKELFARAIHASSNRRKNTFVAVNCGAIPEMLLESELFGYEEGSFTGAKKGGKIGKFLLADGGTLFLDEIGDMPLYLQTKLLRVLDNKKVDRVGGAEPIDIDVHIIAATNKNLEEMVQTKEFREDLYYRLNVIPILIPPLRDRRDDIPLLVKQFIKKYNQKFSKNILGLSEDVNKILLDYSWPGNVRELDNCIEYMVSFETNDYIEINNLPNKLQNIFLSAKDSRKRTISHNEELSGSLKELLAKREKEIIENMVSKYDKPLTVKNIREICKKLDISVASFYRKYK